MTEAEVIALQQENERLKNLVSSLESQLAWLRKKVFGSMSAYFGAYPPTLNEPLAFKKL